jgi:hypothetical protein
LTIAIAHVGGGSPEWLVQILLKSIARRARLDDVLVACAELKDADLPRKFHSAIVGQKRCTTSDALSADQAQSAHPRTAGY